MLPLSDFGVLVYRDNKHKYPLERSNVAAETGRRGNCVSVVLKVSGATLCRLCASIYTLQVILEVHWNHLRSHL